MPPLPDTVTQVLEEAFQKESTPSVTIRKELAAKTGLNLAQVCTWFVRRRRYCSAKIVPSQVGFTEAQRAGLHQARQKHGDSLPTGMYAHLGKSLGLKGIQVSEWFRRQRRKCNMSVDRSSHTRTSSDRNFKTNSTASVAMSNHSSLKQANTLHSTGDRITNLTSTTSIFPLDDFFGGLKQSFLSQSQILSKSLSQNLSGTFRDLMQTFSEDNQRMIASVDRSLRVVNRTIESGHSSSNTHNCMFEALNAKNDERFDALETRMSGVDQKFDTLEDKISSVSRMFDTMQTIIASVNQRVDSLETKVASVNQQLETQDGKFTNVDNRVINLETSIRGFDRQVDTLKTQMASVNQRIDTNETKMTCIDERLDFIESNNSCLNQKFDTLNIKMTDVDQRCVTKTASIDNRVDEIGTKISCLNEQFSKIESKIASLDESLACQQIRIEIAQLVSELCEQVESMPLTLDCTPSPSLSPIYSPLHLFIQELSVQDEESASSIST